ncbi:Saccharopine dehydrogenase-domain-containing protein [Lentinula aff. detonsa]|nr:Saccharopine dehydrogenase-domain-containing protein [Lentinula aff. detonsa]
MVAAPAVRWIVRRMYGTGTDREEKGGLEIIVAGKERGELVGLEGVVRGMGVGVGVGKGGVVFKQIEIDFGERKGKGKGGELEELVRDVDVVISLLPSPLHPPLASLCITHHTHLVTASYISPEMRSLDTEARRRGVLLLNEIGLDPGVDHVGAVEMVERVKGGGKGNKGIKEGGKGKVIKSFVSFCGGLPEPLLVQGNGYGHENELGHGYGYPPAGPLNYKFSWSPRGVLTAALNGARYVLGGEEVVVSPGGGILAPNNIFRSIDFDSGSGSGSESGSGYGDPELRNLRGMLEGLPNRDSVGYIGMYGLGELGSSNGELGSSGELRTILRGTLRYKGFSSLLDEFRKEGFLDVDRVVGFGDLGDLGGVEDLGDATKRERIWKEVVRRIRNRNQKQDVDKDNSYSENEKNEEEEEDDNDPLARPLAWLLSAKTGTPPPPPPSSSTFPSTSPWIGLPPLPSSPSTTQTTQTTQTTSTPTQTTSTPTQTTSTPTQTTSSPQTTSTSSPQTTSTSSTQTQMTPLDLFTLLLSHKLQYGDGERDMVVLVHEVVTRDVDTRDVDVDGDGADGENVVGENGDGVNGDGDKEGYIPEEIHTSSLVIYGSYYPVKTSTPPPSPSSTPNPNPNPSPTSTPTPSTNPNPNPPHHYYYESAMARSVGIPVAIAALAVLDGVVEPVETYNAYNTHNTHNTHNTSNTSNTPTSTPTPTPNTPTPTPKTYTYPRIPLRGVHGPTHVSIRERVLEGMREAGIGMREGVRRVWVRREGEGVKREGGEGERGKGGLEYALIRARREQRGKERREERGREVM